MQTGNCQDGICFSKYAESIMPRTPRYICKHWDGTTIFSSCAYLVAAQRTVARPLQAQTCPGVEHVQVSCSVHARFVVSERLRMIGWALPRVQSYSVQRTGLSAQLNPHRTRETWSVHAVWRFFFEKYAEA